ncbi:molybdenum ABC transporter ATP-binding protein [Mucilaginibacter hurinus]|uniref:Molybdenum ABC transporter ATP-binding protein n=1 Tax=Mucilaginibacter hurinus TaxID=2201324 RepID=A0A367GSJ7_9SPHI|nr:ATP-binding cassette domain-containing protein [Mucilaginibacter hurinus]RCH55683.1 molybdenum ABC transporter ATP-binding protein [Mucilaginibacter hurinus]
MITVSIEKKLRTYGGGQALKLAAEFLTGSVTKIYGPSGAGKTTLLKMLAGLVRPEKGKIVFNGETWLDTERNIDMPPQKRKIGFVFQDYALFPNMTVREHLQYATHDDAWIQRLLAVSNMTTFTSHKPAYLSGGQQQRLAILRALATKPQLMLMDEPFSALDTQIKIVLISELQHIFNELATTVLIVSHNLSELESFDGNVLYVGNQ